MKIKAKSPEPKGRLTTSISQDVIDDVELYAVGLSEETGTEPTISSVVEAMLVDVMKNDREFQAYKRNYANK